MSNIEILNNLKELVVKEKEKCKELSNECLSFIVTLNDISLAIEELEKPKENRSMSSLFIFDSIKKFIRGEKERYLQWLKYKRYVRIQPIQEFISFLDNVLSYFEQLEKEEFSR
jgi:DNA repair exonuclease SbcCD ATPase subunit